MSRITLGVLLACGVKVDRARAYLVPLQVALARFGIETAEEIAAFLGQALHESRLLECSEELLSYSSAERILAVFRRLRTRPRAEIDRLVRNPLKLANAAYAGVNGNKDPNDGWAYRGRGLFQLTGLANYRAASKAIGRDYVADPGLVALPEDGALTAAWYWSMSGAQRHARACRWPSCTAAINGPAMLGHAEREALRLRALAALQQVA